MEEAGHVGVCHRDLFVQAGQSQGLMATTVNYGRKHRAMMCVAEGCAPRVRDRFKSNFAHRIVGVVKVYGASAVRYMELKEGAFLQLWMNSPSTFH